MEQVYLMHRRGKFKPFQHTSNQCKGKYHSEYHYHIMFLCNVKLDKNGFLLDHQLIDDAIQDIQLSGSCEEMHLTLKDCFDEVMKKSKLKRNVLAYKAIISPTIPNGVAYMEYIQVYKETGYKFLTLF